MEASFEAFLFEFIQFGNKKKVEELIEQGVNVNAKSKGGQTALIYATHCDKLDIVELLLKKGAIVNTRIEDGKTALMYAALLSKLDIVKLLLENGAIVNAKTESGNTALHYAAGSGKLDIIKVLLERGADVNAKNEIGTTALIYATHYGKLDNVKLLLENGADVNAKTEIGNTALHYTAGSGNLHIVKLLLEKGADIAIQNNDGMTAYDLAKTSEMKKLLLEPKWKGFRKEFLENMDQVLGEDGVNWSFCPVCLEYVRREDGCMYMSHNCKAKGKYYNAELYEKYKTGTGIITWCTICNRICANVRGEYGNTHKHYKLGDVNGPKPDYAPLNIVADVFFQNDCRPNNGGGGPPEKLARFRRLRKHILELQDDVGKIGHEKAMTELVEEMWNAPLVREKKTIEKIEREKKWNIPLEAFKFRENEAAAGPAANVRRPEADRDLKPVMRDAGMNFMGEEGPLIEFKHRQPDGSINKHDGALITKESLKEWLTGIVKEFGLEKFGHCYMYPGTCKARMYPEELKDLVPEELYEEYRRKFNEKFGRGVEGGSRRGRTMKGGRPSKSVRKSQKGGLTPYAPGIFEPAKDAVCYLPRKTRKNKRSSN